MGRFNRIRYHANEDYYDILGIQPSASADEIREAFRKLAKQYHPDLNPGRAEWAKRQFQRINTAYVVLGDPIQKVAYDTLRDPSTTTGSSPTSTGGFSSSTSTRRSSTNSWQQSAPSWNLAESWLLVVLVYGMILFGVYSIFTTPPPPQPPDILDSAATIIAANATNAASTRFTNPPFLRSDTCPNRNASIIWPRPNVTVLDSFEVIGTAAGRQFKQYTVEIANASYPPNDISAEHKPFVWKSGQPKIGDVLVKVTKQQLPVLQRGETYRVTLIVEYEGGIFGSCDVWGVRMSSK